MLKKFENKVWLATPTMHGEELEYMKSAYETNWMSTVGENINVVEKDMAEYVGCKYAVALSSGTAGLHLAMKLAGVKPGDKVVAAKYSGTDIKVDGAEYTVVRISDILAVVE